jgi:DNA/RNA-binding domain of Phe-tRNA-synthetase-like protein
MKKVYISEEIKNNCPDLKVACVWADVSNSESGNLLWEDIEEEQKNIAIRFPEISLVNKWKPIQATREAYKKCGKDPNRYRPSAEALIRRVLRGLALYKVDTLVDLINLVSIHTGYSIGAFDADKLAGEKLVLGIGKEGEPYTGIGRGELNIHGLPVYRDEVGGFGTPTSDEERTKISLSTKHLLVIINGYSGEEGLAEAVEYTKRLLEKYAEASNIREVYVD